MAKPTPGQPAPIGNPVPVEPVPPSPGHGTTPARGAHAGLSVTAHPPGAARSGQTADQPQTAQHDAAAHPAATLYPGRSARPAPLAHPARPADLTPTFTPAPGRDPGATTEPVQTFSPGPGRGAAEPTSKHAGPPRRLTRHAPRLPPGVAGRRGRPGWDRPRRDRPRGTRLDGAGHARGRGQHVRRCGDTRRAPCRGPACRRQARTPAARPSPACAPGQPAEAGHCPGPPHRASSSRQYLRQQRRCAACTGPGPARQPRRRTDAAHYGACSCSAHGRPGRRCHNPRAPARRPRRTGRHRLVHGCGGSPEQHRRSHRPGRRKQHSGCAAGCHGWIGGSGGHHRPHGGTQPPRPHPAHPRPHPAHPTTAPSPPATAPSPPATAPSQPTTATRHRSRTQPTAAPSQTTTAPSQPTAAPSRTATAPSRPAAPSQTTTAPSRPAAPSQTTTAPSRTAAPSQTTTAPSQPTAAPSQRTRTQPTRDRQPAARRDKLVDAGRRGRSRSGPPPTSRAADRAGQPHAQVRIRVSRQPLRQGAPPRHLAGPRQATPPRRQAGPRRAAPARAPAPVPR